MPCYAYQGIVPVVDPDRVVGTFAPNQETWRNDRHGECQGLIGEAGMSPEIHITDLPYRYAELSPQLLLPVG